MLDPFDDVEPLTLQNGTYPLPYVSEEAIGGTNKA